MKKLALLSIVAFGVLSITSCQKNYTCVCHTTTTGTNAGQFSTAHDSTIFTLTEKSTHHAAIAWCAALGTQAPGIPDCALQ